MNAESPFHEGELFIQQRAGEERIARRNGQIISDKIVSGALGFIEEQPMAILGSIDGDRQVWASVLFGRPGFMNADEKSLHIDLTQSVITPMDPLWNNIEIHSQVGLLIIELATRRRLRVNGQVAQKSQSKLEIDVEQAYPNCPKYIQRRQIISAVESSPDKYDSKEEGTTLGPDQKSTVLSADTFFVASHHPERGVDASHRGGNPGFIKILNDNRIRIPDFRGNSMFNTLGNLNENPRAGLIFLDFERLRTLQITGATKILWDIEDKTGQTGGTNRFWDFKPERWLQIERSIPFQWEFLDYSPHNPAD